MGTSSSNFGPKRNIPLLPDWNDHDSDTNTNTGNQDANNDSNSDKEKEDSGGQNQQNQNNQKDVIPLTGNWSGAKRSLGTSSKNPTKTNFSKAVKSYIKASGGSKNIAKSAIHGQRVAGQIVSFFNGIQKEGLNRTYEKFGLGQVTGKSVEQVFNNLAELLSSGGGTDEETIARNAVIEALSKIYEDFDLENNSLDSLNKLTDEQAEFYLQYYISSYIYERWLHELGVKIEEKDISPSDIVKAEQNAFDFIQSSVELKFEDYNLTTLDYSSKAGKKLIEEIFIQAYSIIETL